MYKIAILHLVFFSAVWASADAATSSNGGEGKKTAWPNRQSEYFKKSSAAYAAIAAKAQAGQGVSVEDRQALKTAYKELGRETVSVNQNLRKLLAKARDPYLGFQPGLSVRKSLPHSDAIKRLGNQKLKIRDGALPKQELGSVAKAPSQAPAIVSSKHERGKKDVGPVLPGGAEQVRFGSDGIASPKPGGTAPQGGGGVESVEFH